MNKMVEYRYGTAIPVLKTIIDVFSPKHILELGVGRHSTSLMYCYEKVKLTCIESDKNWIEEVKKVLPEREGFNIIHHNLPFSVHTRRHQIDSSTRDECIKFYKDQLDIDMDFLFIDHIAGLRVDSLIELHRFFDLIAYHDSEDSCYLYDLFDKRKSIDYFHIENKTPLVYTGILIQKDRFEKLGEFLIKLSKNNSDYCETYDIPFRDLGVKIETYGY